MISQQILSRCLFKFISAIILCREISWRHWLQAVSFIGGAYLRDKITDNDNNKQQAQQISYVRKRTQSNCITCLFLVFHGETENSKHLVIYFLFCECFCRTKKFVLATMSMATFIIRINVRLASETEKKKGKNIESH